MGVWRSHCIEQRPLDTRQRTATRTIFDLKFFFSNGKWPCEWKKGVWSSIFKKDDPLDRENYWPITVHFAMDKVLEQLVSEQITTKFDNYLEQYITA